MTAPAQSKSSRYTKRIWWVLVVLAIAALAVVLFLPSDQLVLKVKNVTIDPIVVTAICDKATVSRSVWLKPGEEMSLVLFSGESHGSAGSWPVQLVVMDRTGRLIDMQTVTSNDLAGKAFEAGSPDATRPFPLKGER